MEIGLITSSASADFLSRPLILIGDLNFNPGDANYAPLINGGWHDSYDATATPNPATFLYDLPDIPGGRIDPILYRGDGLTALACHRLTRSGAYSIMTRCVGGWARIEVSRI